MGKAAVHMKELRLSSMCQFTRFFPPWLLGLRRCFAVDGSSRCGTLLLDAAVVRLVEEVVVMLVTNFDPVPPPMLLRLGIDVDPPAVRRLSLTVKSRRPTATFFDSRWTFWGATLLRFRAGSELL
jgi:hypothetical protein